MNMHMSCPYNHRIQPRWRACCTSVATAVAAGFVMLDELVAIMDVRLARIEPRAMGDFRPGPASWLPGAGGLPLGPWRLEACRAQSARGQVHACVSEQTGKLFISPSHAIKNWPQPQTKRPKADVDSMHTERTEGMQIDYRSCKSAIKLSSAINGYQRTVFVARGASLRAPA